MEKSNQNNCDHPQFAVKGVVQRKAKEGGTEIESYTLYVSASCFKCGRQFYFVGPPEYNEEQTQIISKILPV